MDQLCTVAGRRTVADIMHTLGTGESIRREDTLQEAAHHFVLGRYHWLLVKDGRVVVGILRLSDVFAEICSTTKRVHAK